MLVQKLPITYIRYISIVMSSLQEFERVSNESRSIDLIYRYSYTEIWNRSYLNEQLRGTFVSSIFIYCTIDDKIKEAFATRSHLTSLHRFDYALIPY